MIGYHSAIIKLPREFTLDARLAQLAGWGIVSRCRATWEAKQSTRLPALCWRHSDCRSTYLGFRSSKRARASKASSFYSAPGQAHTVYTVDALVAANPLACNPD